jgi:AcrR family transcriptional regulator
MSAVQRRPQVRPSPNGSPRTRVTELQRARMLSAAAEVVAELGYEGMSVARVTSRAGVSRRTFYDLFTDREDCFLAVFDDAVARIALVAVPAYEGAGGWRGGVRAGLSKVLQFIGDEPVLGGLVFVDSLGAGHRVLERRAQWLATLTAIVDRGRSQLKTGPEPPPLTAEGVVGAVLSVIHARSGKPVLGLLNPLMAMIMLPYLGQREAAKELTRVTPRTPRKAQRPTVDPLVGLDMRLTHRTLRVLAAIAERPGASNRQIADRAGIQDQGQISKLLGRLAGLDLIENHGRGQTKGEANAWGLTGKGKEVEGAIRAQTG